MELVELSAEEYGTLFGGEWGGPTEPPASLAPPVPGDSLWVSVILQLSLLLIVLSLTYCVISLHCVFAFLMITPPIIIMIV